MNLSTYPVSAVPFADAMPVGIEVAAETGSARVVVVVTRMSDPWAFFWNILEFHGPKKGMLLHSLGRHRSKKGVLDRNILEFRGKKKGVFLHS